MSETGQKQLLHLVFGGELDAVVGGTLTGAALTTAPAWAIEQGGADPDDSTSQSGPSQRCWPLA